MQNTRTVQAAPVQSKYNGKWGCTFQNFRTHADVEYLASEVETAAIWFDEKAALQAGERALQALEETGKYPNMCEVW